MSTIFTCVLNLIYNTYNKYIIHINVIRYIYIYFIYCYFSIIRMFTQNKEDRKRVEKALDISGFPSGKVSIIFYIFNMNMVSLTLKIVFRLFVE